MYAEYSAIDKRCDIEVIEYIHTISPGIRIPILFDAFVIKTVNLRGERGKKQYNSHKESEIVKEYAQLEEGVKTR